VQARCADGAIGYHQQQRIASWKDLQTSVDAVLDEGAAATVTPAVFELQPGTYHAEQEIAIAGSCTNITVRGALAGRTVLDARGVARFFHVGDGATLHLVGPLTLRNGRAVTESLPMGSYRQSPTEACFNGGAIYGDSGAKLHLVDIVFDQNEACYGAAVAALQAHLEVTRCTFVSGVATWAGGAILRSYDCTTRYGTEELRHLSVLSSHFQSSTAAMFGGAVVIQQADDVSGCAFFAEVRNSSFVSNAAGMGGAIAAGPSHPDNQFQGDGLQLEVHGTLFRSNYLVPGVFGMGGAIYTWPVESLKLSDCTFERNRALVSGGAVATTRSSRVMDIRGCVFDGNGASLVSSSQAGGSGTENGFKLAGCELGSDCADCGPVAVGGDELCTETCKYSNDNECDDGQFTSCTHLLSGWHRDLGLAPSTTCGFVLRMKDLYMAVWNMTGLTLDSTIRDVCPRECAGTVTFGGAVVADGTITTIQSTAFTNNDAAHGGALWLQGAKVLMHNALLANNSATKGGAIYASKSSILLLFESTFATNSALEAGDVIFGEEDQAHNAIIFNNCSALKHEEDTGPCVDDPAGLLASAGTSCADLLALGIDCEYDLHEMNPAAPAGSLVKTFCLSSCDVCREGQARRLAI
jgi:predicted outer membrane repeat protein